MADAKSIPCFDSIHLPARGTEVILPADVCTTNYASGVGSGPSFSQVQIGLFQEDLAALDKKMEAAQAKLDEARDKFEGLTTLKSELADLQRDFRESLPAVAGTLKAYGAFPAPSVADLSKTTPILRVLKDFDIDLPYASPSDQAPSAEDWYMFVSEDLPDARASVAKKLKAATSELGNARDKVRSLSGRIRETKDALRAWGVPVD